MAPKDQRLASHPCGTVLRKSRASQTPSAFNVWPRTPTPRLHVPFHPAPRYVERAAGVHLARQPLTSRESLEGKRATIVHALGQLNVRHHSHGRRTTGRDIRRTCTGVARLQRPQSHRPPQVHLASIPVIVLPHGHKRQWVQTWAHTLLELRTACQQPCNQCASCGLASSATLCRHWVRWVNSSA